MIKSKNIDFFFQEKDLWWSWKNTFTSTKLEKLHKNAIIKEKKKQPSKVLIVTW